MRQSKSLLAVALALCVIVLGISSVQADRRGQGPGKAVMDAIRQLLPGGRVQEIEMERQVIRVYEVQVKVEGRIVDVAALEDGTILSVEEDVARSELPAAVADKLAELAQGASVSEIEKAEHHSLLKVVPLDKKRVVYEVKLNVNGHEREVLLSESGELIKDPLEMDDSGDGDDDHADDADGDDDDHADHADDDDDDQAEDDIDDDD